MMIRIMAKRIQVRAICASSLKVLTFAPTLVFAEWTYSNENLDFHKRGFRPGATRCYKGSHRNDFPPLTQWLAQHIFPGHL